MVCVFTLSVWDSGGIAGYPPLKGVRWWEVGRDIVEIAGKGRIAWKGGLF